MRKFCKKFSEIPPAEPKEQTLNILEVMPEAVCIDDIIGQFKGADVNSKEREIFRHVLVNLTSEQIIRELEELYG